MSSGERVRDFKKISENKKIPPRDSLTEKKPRSFLSKTASKKAKIPSYQKKTIIIKAKQNDRF
jgi:hypothetical protein